MAIRTVMAFVPPVHAVHVWLGCTDARSSLQVTPTWPRRAEEQPMTLEPDREQAHFSAEQPPPRQDARLPAPYAHSRRPGHRVRPPSQGAQRAVGLTRASTVPVLPSAHRMRRSADFSATVRSGRRIGGSTLVVHHVAAPAARSATPAAVDAVPALIGLVVGKSVGNSVHRHRVSRRLRAQLALRLAQLPPGSATVVRALPPSGSASSAELGVALDRAFARTAGPR